MEDIKVGEGYRVRKDLEAGKGYGARTATESMSRLAGSVVTVAKTLAGTRLLVNEDVYGWTPEMLERIEPKHTYKFGDKVKSDNGNQWWVVGTHGQLTYIVGDERAFKSIEKGVEHEDSEDVQVIATNRLSPWPEPVTIYTKLNDEYRAQVTTDKGIKVGCQQISFEAFDKLAAAVAKIRGNE